MKTLCIVLFLCSFTLFHACKDTDSPSQPVTSTKITFTLEASKQKDTGSTIVSFTGKLTGSYDTLQVTEPGAFILGLDSSIAPYFASDKTYKAQSSYSVIQKVWAGSYRVVMLLQCAHNIKLLSDTITVTIFPDNYDMLQSNVRLYDRYVLSMSHDSIAAMFAPDGVMISGTTVTAQTPAGIKNYLTSFDGIVQVLEQKTVVTAITINGNSGVVTGTYSQKYKILSTNRTGSTSGTVRFEWIKSGNQWLLTKAVTN